MLLYYMLLHANNGFSNLRQNIYKIYMILENVKESKKEFI